MSRLFQKKIIEPGKYGDEVVTSKRIKHWVDTRKEMLEAGIKLVPAPYFHDKAAVPVREKPGPDDSNAKNNAGFWTKLWQTDDGAMWGEIESEREEDADRIGKTVKECSLAAPGKWTERGRTWEDCITHIALTNKAKAPTGDGFVPVVAMSSDYPFQVFSLEMANSSEGMDDTKDDKDPAGDGENTQTSGLDSLLELLAKHGIELPEDTNETNFAAFLGVALTALNAQEKKQEGEDLTQQPEGAKAQKPSPIAMSHELEFAAKLLESNGLTNPSTKKAFTVDEMKVAAQKDKATAYVAMSSEDQAMTRWAKGEAKQKAADILKKAVEGSGLPPAFAKKAGKFIDDNFVIELSEEGQRKDTWVDLFLDLVQMIPKGAFHNAARVDGQDFSIDFENDPSVEVHTFSEGVAEMTDKEVEAGVDEILSI